MRKIEIIANQYYGGDTIRALKEILDNGGSVEEYKNEFTKEETNFLINHAFSELIDSYGGEKSFKKAFKRQLKLDQLEITEEEIKTSTKNPYKQKLLKSMLHLLIMECGIVAATFITGDNAVLGVGSSIATGILSMTAAGNLIKYFKYKKLKKQIDNDPIFLDPEWEDKHNERKVL